MKQINQEEYSLIFDGACLLCSSAVHFLYKRLKDGNYKFIPSQSDIGEEYIRKYELGNMSAHTLILIHNDNVFIKSKAVFMILNDIPSYWKILGIFRVLPTKFLDWLYDRIANNRYLFFGKRNGGSCFHEIEKN